MVIEYKIKFEKDGITVSQRMEPNSTSPQVANGAVRALSTPAGAGSANPLVEFSSGPNPPEDDSSGPNPPEDDSSGPNPRSENASSGPLGPSPIFALGPLIFNNNPAQTSAVPPQQPPPTQPPNDQPPKAYRARATS